MTQPSSPPTAHDCDLFFRLRDITALMPPDAAALWLLRNPEFIACAREWPGWRLFDGDELEVLGRIDAELARIAMDSAK